MRSGGHVNNDAEQHSHNLHNPLLPHSHRDSKWFSDHYLGLTWPGWPPTQGYINFYLGPNIAESKHWPFTLFRRVGIKSSNLTVRILLFKLKLAMSLIEPWSLLWCMWNWRLNCRCIVNYLVQDIHIHIYYILYIIVYPSKTLNQFSCQ